jgi:hypothetical protein
MKTTTNRKPIMNSHSAPTTPVRPGSLRRLLTRVPLALGLVIGIIAATATPADAAGSVVGCFKSASTAANVVGIPVQLQAFDPSIGTWVTVATQNLGNNSCVAWTIGPALHPYYLRLAVNYQAYGAFWHGSSPLLAMPGNLQAHLGTGVVKCWGCVI